MDFFTSPYFILFARLCVGGVFIVSAVTKMLDREGTAVSMSRYPFLPSGFGRFIAYTFPYVELLVGGMLVLGLFTRLAALAAVGLFVLFTGLIVYDLTRGQSSSCHCFGRLSSEKLTPMAVVRNAVLLVMGLIVFAGFDGWFSIDGAINGNAGAGLLIANNSLAAQPGVANVVPVALLAMATVAAIVLGGQAIATVRDTLRGLTPR
jgi:hypothetical protein